MKRKYSIGFFVGMLLLILMFVYIYQYSHMKVEERYDVRAKETLTLDGYWIKEKDGYMIVYYGDGERVYEYTSICISDLPEEIQRQITQGIYMEYQSEVYSFLENYSS